jgi:hypothetical protein
MVACFLHSQVAAIAAAFKHAVPDAKLAYVMTEGGALPIAISDLLYDLCRVGWIDVTVTAGQAFGGEREAVNVWHALELTRDCDAVVVGMGPGSLGSDSELGFSALEVASVLQVAESMEMTPIVALRWSDADGRERHRGLSHHSSTALRLTSARATVALPADAPDVELGRHAVCRVDVPDVGTLFTDAGLDVRTMGRTPREDPGFFAYAAAAGVVAAQRTR